MPPAGRRAVPARADHAGAAVSGPPEYRASATVVRVAGGCSPPEGLCTCQGSPGRSAETGAAERRARSRKRFGRRPWAACPQRAHKSGRPGTPAVPTSPRNGAGALHRRSRRPCDRPSAVASRAESASSILVPRSREKLQVSAVHRVVAGCTPRRRPPRPWADPCGSSRCGPSGSGRALPYPMGLRRIPLGDRGPRAGIGRGGPLPGVTSGDSDVPTGSPPSRGR